MTFNLSIFAFFLIKFLIRFHSQVLSEIHNKYSYTAGLRFYKNKSKGKKNNKVIHIKEINEKPQWNKAGVNVTFRSFCKAL